MRKKIVTGICLTLSFFMIFSVSSHFLHSRANENTVEITEADGSVTVTGPEKSSVDVYCTTPSTYSIIVPKIITLDGKTKEGTYRVKVKGDISGNQRISVTTPETFQLSEKSTLDRKADVTVTVYSEKDGGAKTEWTQDEIKPDTYEGTGTTTGKVSAKDITAGSWAGGLPFYIRLIEGNEDNPDIPTKPDNTPEPTQTPDICETSIAKIAYTGKEFNAMVKTLASSWGEHEYTEDDYNVYGFEVTKEAPGDGIKTIELAETDAKYNITAYMDGNIVKLYTKADKIAPPVDSGYMFYKFKSIRGTADFSKFCFKRAKNLSYTFSEFGFDSMTDINFGDTFDTRNAKDMTCMFLRCGFNSMKSLDLGENFYTDKVTDMKGMFVFCGYSSMTELNLGPNFNTKNVQDMRYMFSCCGYKCLKSLDLGQSFDTSKVINMESMFHGCGLASLNTFNIGNKFNTENVTNMKNMFCGFGACCLKSLDLGQFFNTSKVTNMESMFSECGTMSMTFFNLGNKFNTENVTTMENMFYNLGTYGLTSLDLGPVFNVNKVIIFDTMFDNCGTENIIITAPTNAAKTLSAKKVYRTIVEKTY